MSIKERRKHPKAESDILAAFDTEKHDVKSTYTTAQLPEEMIALLPETEYTHAPLAYLTNRKVHRFDIVRYKIGYCFTGKYAKSLIFPIIYHNKTASFITRGIGPKGTYRKPDKSDSWFFGYDLALHVNKVVVVEGPFDAMRATPVDVQRDGYAGVGLMGTNFTQRHVELVQEAGWEQMTFALDADASRKSLKLVEKLHKYGVRVSVCIMDKDPSDYSRRDLVEYLQNQTILYRKDGWEESKILAEFSL